MNDQMDIPEFLKRTAAAADYKWNSAAAVERVTRPQDDEDMPLLPEGLRWAQTSYEESGFMVTEGIIPRRWKEDTTKPMFVLRSLNERAGRRAAKLAEFKSAMAEKKAKEPKKEPKGEFGTDLIIKEVYETIPRRPDSSRTKRHLEMKAYIKKNKKATVADVIRDTGYTEWDYHYDLNRKQIKVDVR